MMKTSQQQRDAFRQYTHSEFVDQLLDDADLLDRLRGEILSLIDQGVACPADTRLLIELLEL